MDKNLPLGCVEPAVPGANLREKLSVLESRVMWLELVNDEKKKLGEIINTLQSFNAPIWSVQAYRLHSLNMLSDNDGERKAAVRHAEETIRMASAVGAKNAVTTIVYGEPLTKTPLKRCLETYKKLGKLGEKLNITVSIEPLGKNRTSFLPSVSDVYRLVSDLDSRNLRLMADTMHIHDNEEDVAEVIKDHINDISELQLRDTDSRPPGQGSIEFGPIMKIVKEKFNGLICLEYKPGSDIIEDFNSGSKFVNDFISAARL